MLFMNIYRLPKRFISLFRITVVLTVFAMAFGPLGTAYAQAAGACICERYKSPDTSGTTRLAPIPRLLRCSSTSAADTSTPGNSPATPPGQSNVSSDSTGGTTQDSTPGNSDGTKGKSSTAGSNGSKSTQTGQTMTSQSSGNDYTVDPQRDQTTQSACRHGIQARPSGRIAQLFVSAQGTAWSQRPAAGPIIKLQQPAWFRRQHRGIRAGHSRSRRSVRINRTGVNNLYSGEDYFYSSLDGELASSSPGVYGALSEKGNFLKYVYSTSTNSWTVTDKKGTVYTFGSTTASRLDNPNNANQIYEWKLDSVRDANNNYIKYTYYKDAGEIYPSTILYTGNGSTDGPLEVDFLRTSRSDVRSSAQTGFVVTSNYLINEIDMKVSGDWVRKYTLSYTTGDNGARSLLGSITEAGKDGQGVVTTLPATSFSYQHANPGWTATSTNWNLPIPIVNYQ